MSMSLVERAKDQVDYRDCIKRVFRTFGLELIGKRFEIENDLKRKVTSKYREVKKRKLSPSTGRD